MYVYTENKQYNFQINLIAIWLIFNSFYLHTNEFLHPFPILVRLVKTVKLYHNILFECVMTYSSFYEQPLTKIVN